MFHSPLRSVDDADVDSKLSGMSSYVEYVAFVTGMVGRAVVRPCVGLTVKSV